MFDEYTEKAMLYYLIFKQEEYILSQDDFVNEKNKKIINAINELKAEKQEVSMLNIKSKIKSNPRANTKLFSNIRRICSNRKSRQYI